MAGGKRRADRQTHARPRLGPLSRLGGTVLGIVLGCAAWWFLVRAAIDFARLAVVGEARAWGFAVGAAVGAVLCLLLVLVLASRVLVTLGLVSEYQPRRAAPKRRAEPAHEPDPDLAPRRVDRDHAPRRRASRHREAPDHTVG